MRVRFGILFLAAGLCLTTGPLFGADQAPDQSQEKIYGSQLMTRQERLDHRAKMQAAKTAEEREQIRREHHEKMKARAKDRGMTLPDEPPATGMGKGMGPRGGRGR